MSTHLKKLDEAGFVVIDKKFVNNKPKTSVRLTDKGITAFREYVTFMESIIKQSK